MGFMSRIAWLGLALLLPLLPSPGAAQADAETRRLILLLMPRSDDETRGLRLRQANDPAMAATTAPPEIPSASIRPRFATGSAVLDATAQAALAPLARALASVELAHYRFRLEGHCDTVGPREMNQRLSERRAQAVRDFLVQRHGVDPQRLEIVGRGEDDPLVPTPDNTPEPRNRRVQVINLGG